MLMYDINGQKLNSLDYEVLEAFQSIFNSSFDSSKLKYNKSKKYIKYNGYVYKYRFKNGQIEFTKYILKENVEWNGKRNVKTKKGVVKKGEQVILTTLFAMLSATALLTVMSPSHERNEKKKNTYSNELSIDDFIEPTHSDISQLPIEIPQEEIENIFLQIPEISSNDLDLEKRVQTEEFYGKYINKYAERYGMDASFLKALITQERPNEMKANPAQITTSLCGGNGFYAPIFINGKYQGEEKIFILGRYYDNYLIKDLKTNKDSSMFPKTARQEMQKAIELQQQGYEILKFTDIADQSTEEGFELNFKVSAIYLSYLTNKKGDLLKGAISYNAGPSLVSKDDSYERLFQGYENMDDPLYLQHIAKYFTQEDYIEGFTIQLSDSRKIHYSLNPILEEAQNEKITNIIRR